MVRGRDSAQQIGGYYGWYRSLSVFIQFFRDDNCTLGSDLAVLLLPTLDRECTTTLSNRKSTHEDSLASRLLLRNVALTLLMGTRECGMARIHCVHGIVLGIERIVGQLERIE